MTVLIIQGYRMECADFFHLFGREILQVKQTIIGYFTCFRVNMDGWMCFAPYVDPLVVCCIEVLQLVTQVGSTTLQFCGDPFGIDTVKYSTRQGIFNGSSIRENG